MPLPPSFAKAGFAPLPKPKFKRLLIETDGRTDTGKTEFALSAPGPGIVLSLDRGHDAMLDNPHPPETRRSDFVFKPIEIPKATQMVKDEYLAYWKSFKDTYYTALGIPEARTIVIDGDSDSWELQRLAEHGKLTGVFPQTRYSDVYAARRAFVNRGWQSGKIIIATNKLKPVFRDMKDSQGNPIKDNQGEVRREKTNEMESQGFPDHEYLWQIWLRHLYRPPGVNAVTKRQTARSWGIKILKCKANMELVGEELWGADCCFASLVQYVYPQVQLSEWGY